MKHLRRFNKILAALLAFAVLFAGIPGANFTTVDTMAASRAAVNRKAKALYRKKVKSLKKSSTSAGYKYYDIDGDGIVECLIEKYPGSSGGGSGRSLLIYTYKKGKLKCLLNADEYGFAKIIIYRKTKSVILWCAGHGGEMYRYYKMSGGKYRFKASKGRVSLAGGGMENGPWYYSGKGGEISKSAFTKIENAIKKGKKISKKVSFTWA